MLFGCIHYIHCMKTLIALLLLLPGAAYSQNSSSDSAWIVDNYTKKETYITMRDGARLYTVIYSPKDRTEKHPILIIRSPYSSAPYGEGRFRHHFTHGCFLANHIATPATAADGSRSTIADLAEPENNYAYSAALQHGRRAHTSSFWLQCQLHSRDVFRTGLQRSLDYLRLLSGNFDAWLFKSLHMIAL